MIGRGQSGEDVRDSERPGILVIASGARMLGRSDIDHMLRTATVGIHIGADAEFQLLAA
jgi:hypothetical protein